MHIIDINGNARECESVLPDPDFPGYVKVTFKRPNRSYFEWYKMDEFKAKNPRIANAIAADMPLPKQEDLGRVSSSTKDSFTDKSKVWKEDMFKDLPVWISRGKGEGQVRKVKSNTKNKIFIDAEWEIRPNKTSQYLISENVHNPHAFGNNMPPAGSELLTTKKRKSKMS